MLLLLPSSCSEVDLYQWKSTPYQANKLTLSANVCTDDLHQANFPIKILFIVDMSMSLRSAGNDPNGRRGQAIEDVINLWGKNPNYHFGITTFGYRAKNMLMDQSGQNPIGFSRDLQSCSTRQTRSRLGPPTSPSVTAGAAVTCGPPSAWPPVSSPVTSLPADPGQVARTTYVLILFSGGPPIPEIGRCACRERELSNESATWGVCGWKDCDSTCKVTCPPNTKCDGDLCLEDGPDGQGVGATAEQ